MSTIDLFGVEIDTTTATVAEMLEARSNLLECSYTDAFPGSREWLKAEQARKAADEIAQRADVAQALEAKYAAKRAADKAAAERHMWD